MKTLMLSATCSCSAIISCLAFSAILSEDKSKFEINYERKRSFIKLKLSLTRRQTKGLGQTDHFFRNPPSVFFRTVIGSSSNSTTPCQHQLADRNPSQTKIN
jgi:hypothetical protein